MQRMSIVLLSALAALFSTLTQNAHASPTITLTRTIAVTTDAEGGSARPEIVATSNRVYVVYLGHIGQGINRTFDVKIFDGNLENVIATKTLVETTATYGGPTDIRIASDGQYLYAFYETHKSTSQTTAVTYLWGAKYVLNDSFDRAAYTATPIASSKPMSELQDGGELLDDPAPLVGPNSVYVATRIKHPLSMAGKTVYRVREFSKEDLRKLAEFDLDLSAAANGRGRVTSLLFWNNTIYMALATTVSDEGINESNDDGAKSDIIVVRMAQNWTFDPQRDVKTISAEPDDRENYVSGFKTNGSHFYLAYKQTVGQPPTGEQRAWIKTFDQDFHLIHQEKVRSTTWGPGGEGIRPSLEVWGNRIFSGQSAESPGQNLGTGNAEIYLYEISPSFVFRVNGNLSNAVTTTNPVTVEYTIRGGQGQEFFYALDAPALGIAWSYLNSAGQWVTFPADPAQVTPFATAPADGDYLFYSGSAPAGNYLLCLGYDTIPNGHLDAETLVYDCVTVTVQ